MTKLVLPSLVFTALGISAYLCILGLAERNGWFDKLKEIMLHPSTPLPDTNTAGRSIFTGLKPLDELLTALVRFVYSAVSGQLPSFSLFFTYGVGQLIGHHGILMLEGYRKGNRWTCFWPTCLWGLVYQIISIGITLPIYCLLYIWWSPIVQISNSMDPTRQAELLSMDPVKTSTTPLALFFGFIIPTILAALPTPQIQSLDTQQIMLALWQPFPLWISSLAFAVGLLVRSQHLMPDSASQTPIAKIRHARKTYRAIICCSAAVHLAVIACATLPRLVAQLSASDTGMVTLQSVFVPMSVLRPHQIRSMAEGSLTFLQYDFCSASITSLFWVTYTSNCNSGSSTEDKMRAVGKLLLRSVCIGPAAAAVWAIWDRDEQVLQAIIKETKKT